MVETRWTAPGEHAFSTLRELVAELRGGDPLEPVTIIPPTAAAAVGLRRALAREGHGLAAVGFHGLDALAGQLAAPALGDGALSLGVDRELAVTAVRVALERDPGRFAAISHHRSTWETLARTVEEIAGLDDGARDALARDHVGLGAEVVRVHDAVGSAVGAGARAEILRAAARRLRADPGAARHLGPVVVFLPGRIDRRSADLLGALATATRVVLVAALVGAERADAPVIASARAVGAEAGPPPPRPPAAPTRVISANDVDDEIRAAVRVLLARAEAGTPFHSMALVHPAGAPYARAVADIVRSAGIDSSGPATDTLAHTAPGRVLLGLLEVSSTGYARQSLIDLWSCGVVVAPDGGAVPSVVVDERTRRLGIVGGRASWHERIDGRRRWLEDNPVVAEDAPVEVVERRLLRRATETEELDLVEGLLTTAEVLVDALPCRWEDVAQWASDALDKLCGPRVRRTDWPEHELDADTAIRTALGHLHDLATIDPEPSPATVAETVRAALDAPAPRRATAGTGLLVTTLDQPPLVPLDTVVVVGLAEGHIPRLVRDDVLVAEDARRAAELPGPADHTADQHRNLLTALGASSRHRVLTYARHEQRGGRTQIPSRWLLDAIEAAHGRRPRTESLVAGRPVPGVEIVHSHQAMIEAVGDGAVPLHAAERRLASLAGAGDFDAHPASRDPIVVGGATLARSRAADAFTRFDGNVGEGIDVLADDRHLSPTSIETYATCPRRWMLGHALGVGDVDRPEEVDRLQPRDKGTLAHRILERFVGEAIEAGTVPPPGASWGPEGDERLLAIADEEFADFERRGLTGHDRWWDHDRQEIAGVLRETLRRDDRLRAECSATPVAVELTFGRDDAPPLTVPLDDGRIVLLAGQADRVDEVPGGVMVHDYKFASSSPYRGLDRRIDAGGDPLAGGRRLQLLAYAEAAAQQRGVDRSSAWYWFLKPGHTGTRIGYEIGREHRRLFRETLRVLVDGIGAGLFPARSGPFDWWQRTNANCGWCEFDAICPADREEEWERVREDPSLADVALLAEEGAPAFLVTAPVDGEPA